MANEYKMKENEDDSGSFLLAPDNALLWWL